ncbi:hypothetical protein AAC387_Pa01g3243 [Persea americana]
MVFGVHPVSAPPASRRWPPRDLARLSLLHRSSALNFLHQRQCVAAYRLSRRLPYSKSNPSCRLVSSSIDGSISDWDLFSLKQKVCIQTLSCIYRSQSISEFVFRFLLIRCLQTNSRVFFLLSWFLLESDGIEWLSLLEKALVWIKDRIRVLSICSYFDWFVISVVTDLSDVVA